MSIGRKIARLDESIGSTLPDFDNKSAKIIKFLQICGGERGAEERFLQILNMHRHFDRIACHKLVFASHWVFATLPFEPTLLSGHHRPWLCFVFCQGHEMYHPVMDLFMLKAW